MRADGLKDLPRVLHLRNRFVRDKAAKIDSCKARFDQREKIVGLGFSGNETRQTLKGIARTFDEADSIRHECKTGLARKAQSTQEDGPFSPRLLALGGRIP
jgi:hypothetical protein